MLAVLLKAPLDAGLRQSAPSAVYSGIGAAKRTEPRFDLPHNPARPSIRFPAGMPAQGAAGTDRGQCQVQPSLLFSFHIAASQFSIRNAMTGVGLNRTRDSVKAPAQQGTVLS